jgi:hypothetical protein
MHCSLAYCTSASSSTPPRTLIGTECADRYTCSDKLKVIMLNPTSLLDCPMDIDQRTSPCSRMTPLSPLTSSRRTKTSSVPYLFFLLPLWPAIRMKLMLDFGWALACELKSLVVKAAPGTVSCLFVSFYRFSPPLYVLPLAQHISGARFWTFQTSSPSMMSIDRRVVPAPMEVATCRLRDYNLPSSLWFCVSPMSRLACDGWRKPDPNTNAPTVASFPLYLMPPYLSYTSYPLDL